MTSVLPKRVSLSALLLRRLAATAVVLLGCLALATPLAAGRGAAVWLGMFVLAGGLIKSSITAPTRGDGVYLGGSFSFVSGLLLLAAPGLALTGLAWLLGLSFVLDGLRKSAAALWRRGAVHDARPTLLRGVLDIVLGALIALQWPVSGAWALALFVAAHLTADGWALLVRRDIDDEAAELETAERHPDRLLGLPGHAEIARLQQAADVQAAARRHIDRYWLLVFIVTFFAIHVGRMHADWTLVGLLSPGVAVLGDVFFALVLAYGVVTPARLTWRRSTRWAERRAWQWHLARVERQAGSVLVGYPVRRWLVGRLEFARQMNAARRSPLAALRGGLEVGVPLVAVLVALNPMWGFSWYFNTENWATEVWDQWAEQRTDPWRVEMMQAVRAEYGLAPAELLQVRPPGLEEATDFSFIVIGDPGTGDPSQHALRDQLLLLGQRPEVRFVVVASDVIYPAGAMKDYERNFYLPFMGLRQPIYAIPGNHDWYDALEGFAANFFEAQAAQAAMRARVQADRGLTSTTGARIAELIAEAARLRSAYGVSAGLQRGPYFDIQTAHFALIMVDTGVLRTVDHDQWAWLEGALTRARGKFIMVIPGHPFYAGGHDQGQADAPFARLHRLLQKHRVSIVMAGDTHDFEYYREPDPPRSMYHFVNGGGGAYLSIGTALDWPRRPATADAAYYPRTDQLIAKLDRQMPLWKAPLWLWVKDLGAWPSTPELMAAAFDYNQAPFFQSFALVRVEPSAGRVRIWPYGATGRLRWCDLQLFGQVQPAHSAATDPVEFIIPMGEP